MYICIDVNAYSYNRFALHCVTCPYVTLHYIAIRCVALYFTALHSITSPDITTLHCITSIAHCDSLCAIHCMTLRCIALHCVALHCIALRCVAFHSVPFHWYIHCMERHEPVLTPKIPQETSRFMLPCRTSMSAALEIRTCLGSSLPGSCGVGKVRRKTQLEKLWQYHGGTIRWMDGWIEGR